MCPTCQGLGVYRAFRLDKVIDPNLSIEEDCCSIAPSYKTVRFGNIYDNLARIYGFKIDTPWKKIPEKGKEAFLNGIDAKWTRMLFAHPHKRSRWTEYVHWDGVLKEAMGRYNSATSDVYRQNMEALMEEAVCPSCHGSRIKPYPSAAKIQGKTIAEITNLPIEEAAAIFQESAAKYCHRRASQRDPAQAGVSTRRWTRISHAGPHSADALRRRSAARPPRLPDRLGPCQHDLRSG